MKKWKRIIALGACAALIGATVAGCGSSSSDSSDAAADTTGDAAVSAEAETASADESSSTVAAANADNDFTPDEVYTIGYNYYGVGSYAITQLANNEQYVIDAFGNDAVGLSDDFQVDKIVQDFENMISSGCDGIIVWLPADNLYETVINLCEENQIPFVLADKVPTDESIKDELMNCEYFVGAVGPANAEYGTLIADYALDQGWTSCIITTNSQGDPTDTPRVDAFTEEFEANGGTVATTVYSDSQDNIQSYTENALVANPDVDFVYGTGSDNGIGACAAVQNQGLDTPVLCSGLDSEALELLADPDSPMTFVNGDFWISGTMATVLLQNYLDGTPITQEDGSPVWVDDILPFEVSEDQYEDFETYFINQYCYSYAEIQQMSGKYNPDFDYDAFLDVINNYSLEERIAAAQN
ncbi:MAG: substrate-binding domain-containing protein [Clostridiales bacterium]|nr:substrate-binding domain-containing protein [Clostridiales bacterium]